MHPYLVHIDDNPLERELLQMAFEEVEVPVDYRGMASGGACLAAMRDSQDGDALPMLFIVDLNMPQMSGFELVRELKALPRCQDVPVLIYSTSTDERDRQESLALGAFHYVAKPPDYRGIVDMALNIRAWVKQKHAVGPQ